MMKKNHEGWAVCPACGQRKLPALKGSATGTCCQNCGVVVDANGKVEQPAPKHNDLPAVWDLVIADMTARDKVGTARYGTRLQPHNGRDVLVDAYEEALDLCVYLRQAIFERDGK